MKYRRAFFTFIVAVLAFSRADTGSPAERSGDKAPANPDAPLMLVAFAEGRQARFLLIGRDKQNPVVILFESPTGGRLSISHSNSCKWGYETSYRDLRGHARVAMFVPNDYYKAGLPVPGMFDIDGKRVVGIGDDGSQERDLRKRLREQVDSLPSTFREALRDFYRFGLAPEMVPSIDYAATGLVDIVGEGGQLKPYSVSLFYNNHPDEVQQFSDEMTER